MEYEIEKKIKATCTFWIEASSEEEAIEKARQEHIMNARLDEIESLECVGVHNLGDDD